MGFPVLPARIPIADQRGVVNPDWYRFFAAIRGALGGDSATDSSTDTPVLTAGTDLLAIAVQNGAQEALSGPVALFEAPGDLVPPSHHSAPDSLLEPSLSALVASLAGNTGSATCDCVSYIPMVTGEIPAVFIQEPDGGLVVAPYP